MASKRNDSDSMDFREFSRRITFWHYGNRIISRNNVEFVTEKNRYKGFIRREFVPEIRYLISNVGTFAYSGLKVDPKRYSGHKTEDIYELGPSQIIGTFFNQMKQVNRDIANYGSRFPKFSRFKHQEPNPGNIVDIEKVIRVMRDKIDLTQYKLDSASENGFMVKELRPNQFSSPTGYIKIHCLENPDDSIDYSQFENPVCVVAPRMSGHYENFHSLHGYITSHPEINLSKHMYLKYLRQQPESEIDLVTRTRGIITLVEQRPRIDPKYLSIDVLSTFARPDMDDPRITTVGRMFKIQKKNRYIFSTLQCDDGIYHAFPVDQGTTNRRILKEVYDHPMQLDLFRSK